MRQATRRLAECNVKCEEAYTDASKRERFRHIAREDLAAARANQKLYADQHRSVTFKQGDRVMLRTKSLDLFKRAALPEKWR